MAYICAGITERQWKSAFIERINCKERELCMIIIKSVTGNNPHAVGCTTVTKLLLHAR